MWTSGTGTTVVGIPARDEASTVAAVARAADAGLSRAFPGGANVVLLADNGSTDGTVERFLDTDLRARQVVVRSSGIGTGKGTNVFAIADRALELDAERVVLLDADVRSTEPEWIGRLADAVDGPEPAIAVPVYRRDRYEANTTNHLAGPLLAGVFGARVQQPIGGEFAVNRAFLERAATWHRPASSYLYGVDVWLTGNALREGMRVVEVPLGRKLHNSPFPKILRLPQQVLDSLFHVVLRTSGTAVPDVRAAAVREAVDGAAVPQDPAVVASVTSSVAAYLAAHRADVHRLFPTARLLAPAPWGLRIATDDWPHLLADAVQALGDGEFEAARDHLVALYVNRVLTFWDEIEGLDGSEIDALLDRQTARTAHAVRRRGVTFDPTCAPTGFSTAHWDGHDVDPVRHSVPA
ncbi:glycosyltransferase family 2 protein [Umezawaea beigongshangensis]|uniref:glycosyltransferase family 2 protein n=1 Tax=Umezawaea beigongshangensis TaxID=2780383 RepID=UPI0018F1A334|nr:glycosyltransferase [Umezawaea beigongshangensis]